MLLSFTIDISIQLRTAAVVFNPYVTESKDFPLQSSKKEGVFQKLASSYYFSVSKKVRMRLTR